MSESHKEGQYVNKKVQASGVLMCCAIHRMDTHATNAHMFTRNVSHEFRFRWKRHNYPVETREFP